MASKHAKACHRRGEIVTAAIVWLLLGAIVNVAVAWSCAIMVYPLRGKRFEAFHGWSDSHRIFVARADAFGTTRLNTFGSRTVHDTNPSAHSIAPSWSDYPKALDERWETGMNVHANGWPFRSLLYRWVTVGVPRPDGTMGARTRFVRGIGIADYPQAGGMPGFRALPLQPIWPGFAINTIFYAAILWLLFAGPGRIRRWRRRRRGLCPKCAYDLRGTPHPSPLPEGEGVAVCSECGAVVQPRRGAGMEPRVKPVDRMEEDSPAPAGRRCLSRGHHHSFP